MLRIEGLACAAPLFVSAIAGMVSFVVTIVVVTIPTIFVAILVPLIAMLVAIPLIVIVAVLIVPLTVTIPLVTIIISHFGRRRRIPLVMMTAMMIMVSPLTPLHMTTRNSRWRHIHPILPIETPQTQIGIDGTAFEASRGPSIHRCLVTVPLIVGTARSRGGTATSVRRRTALCCRGRFACGNGCRGDGSFATCCVSSISGG